ncbi:MAG TPA: metalloregulator ArsR/SmtB family transcription factor [Sporichthya sp.]|nr:metalloregulator ArsR/SmtB family transcription factor [Sporichthya sp.]
MASAGTRKTPSAPKAEAGHPAHPTDRQISAAVTSFALLADPTRVRMLWALREADLDVASQHLGKLRLAGLVEGRRHGQRIVYRLRGGHVRALLTEALFHADHQTSGTPVHD